MTFSWQHILRNQQRHVVQPRLHDIDSEAFAPALRYLLAPTNQIPTLPNKDHPQDEGLREHLTSFLTSPWLTESYRLKANEGFPAFTERLIREDQNLNITPVTLVITRQQRQGVLRRFLLLLHCLSSVLQLSTSLFARNEKLEEELEEAKELISIAETDNKKLSQELQKYGITAPEESFIELGGLREEVRTLGAKNAQLEEQNKSLLNALANQPPPEPTATISSWDDEGLIIRRQPGVTFEEQIRSLPDSWVTKERLLANMTNPQPNRLTLLFPPEETIETFWNRIPAPRRRGRPVPQNADELRQAMADMLINDPAEPTAPQTPGFLAATGETSLFKIADVPKFTKRAEYWSYRVALERFFSAITEPPPRLFGTALNRIIASWEADDVRTVAGHWKIEPLLHYQRHDHDADGNEVIYEIPRNWKQLQKAFLKSCDEKFLDATITEDSVRDLNNTRPRPGQKPADFLLDFDAAVAKRNDTALLAGTPAMTTPETTAQLIRVMPNHVRSELRKNLAMQGKIMENMTLAELKTPLIYTWTYTPAPESKRGPKVSTIPGQTNAGSQPTRGNNEVKMRRCGINCSYDQPSPAVPQELRGALYWKGGVPAQQNQAAEERNHRARAANICESCRRPRGYHRQGQNFIPIREFRPNNSPPRFAMIPGPRIEDVTEQLALPPSPENPAA